MTAQGKGPVATADHDLFNPLPREKLNAMGASALTDAEVLALLLRTGTRERPVVAFATDILSRLGGLRGLLQATPEKLSAIKGLGPAKQAEIAAASELVNRTMRETLAVRSVLRDPADVRQNQRGVCGALSEHTAPSVSDGRVVSGHADTGHGLPP